MKIGLLWHSFRSENLGVGAISLANLTLIDKCAKTLGINAEYVLIGSSGDFNYAPPAELYTCRLVHFSEKTFIKNPFKLFREIAGCDLIFDIGEGDSFADIYGSKRLIKLFLSQIAAIASGTHLVLSPQTIGPFENRLNAWIAKVIMNKCQKVIARDHQSYALLKSMGIKSIDETIDVALCLPYENITVKRDQSKTAIGLNISALIYHGGYNQSNQFGLEVDYRELTDRFISEVLKSEEYEIHLIAHVIPSWLPVEDDFEVARIYQEKYPQLILPEKFTGPIQAKSYISGLDFFVGARMHATIGAFSSGVPVVPLAYSRKFTGLYESLEYQYVIDMRNESTEVALNKLLQSLREREKLLKGVIEAKSEIDKRLQRYENSIKEFLQAAYVR